MNTPAVDSKSFQPSSASRVVAAAIAGLIVGGAVVFLLRTSGPALQKPRATYTVTFRDAQLTSPADIPKFKAALDDPKIAFRLNLRIKDANGCDFTGLENTVPGFPANNCAQPNGSASYPKSRIQ